MGHAPRLPNGMLGWEFDGIYTSFGCQPDPIGWIDGIPVFRDGKHTYEWAGKVDRICRLTNVRQSHQQSDAVWLSML